LVNIANLPALVQSKLDHTITQRNRLDGTGDNGLIAVKLARTIPIEPCARAFWLL
jgi:hypothetical protein